MRIINYIVFSVFLLYVMDFKCSMSKYTLIPPRFVISMGLLNKIKQ